MFGRGADRPDERPETRPSPPQGRNGPPGSLGIHESVADRWLRGGGGHVPESRGTSTVL